MEEYFGYRQKPPEKAELNELLTRKTFQQGKDKIKNMLRKRKKEAC